MKQAERRNFRCLAGCPLRSLDARKIYEVRKSSSGDDSELTYGRITLLVRARSIAPHGPPSQRMLLADSTLVHPKGTREGVVHLLVDPATAEQGDVVALLCDKCRQTPPVLKPALYPGPAPVRAATSPLAQAAVGGEALLELEAGVEAEEVLGLSTNGVRIRIGRHSLGETGQRFLKGADVAVSWILQTTDSDPAGREGTMGQGHGIVRCGVCSLQEYLEMLEKYPENGHALYMNNSNDVERFVPIPDIVARLGPLLNGTVCLRRQAAAFNRIAVDWLLGSKGSLSNGHLDGPVRHSTLILVLSGEKKLVLCAGPNGSFLAGHKSCEATFNNTAFMADLQAAGGLCLSLRRGDWALVPYNCYHAAVNVETTLSLNVSYIAEADLVEHLQATVAGLTRGENTAAFGDGFRVMLEESTTGLLDLWAISREASTQQVLEAWADTLGTVRVTMCASLTPAWRKAWVRKVQAALDSPSPAPPLPKRPRPI